MNLPLLAKHLGTVCLLIGGSMVFSLPWAVPQLGVRRGIDTTMTFERDGFLALVYSILISAAVGTFLSTWGRHARGKLFRREAMAIVGLSWVCATLLGGLPFYLSETFRGPAVRLGGEDRPLQLHAFHHVRWGQWIPKPPIPNESYPIVAALVDAGAKGLTPEAAFEIDPDADRHLRQLTADSDWDEICIFPNDASRDRNAPPPDRVDNYRLRWVEMTFVDSLFESQSGFSTTGATVISDLEDPYLIPHCMLFWRSTTHFLGGLGIIVLFVVILGQGSSGKAMMRVEMPGPSQDSSQSRMQHTAWLFAGTYVGLNAILTVLLKLVPQIDMTWFDALCHAFGTMATGGFSTYNRSLGHFDSAVVDYIVIAFMGLAGTNFILLFYCLKGQPGKLFSDAEWRTYFGLIVGVTTMVMIMGMLRHDFYDASTPSVLSELAHALRFGLFQVVSVITTTGYGTDDFDTWNSFGRGVLFLLMFVGGCAGSTGGGMKVIRHVLFVKILKLEIERSFHPNVVRPLKLGGKPVEDTELRRSILVYFCLVLVVFIHSWLFIVSVEPDLTWGNDAQHKLIDSASAVAATLNNIGPGLGTVGATQNYGHFSASAKLLFTWLMMLGRVEIFAIFVLLVPSFWKSN